MHVVIIGGGVAGLGAALGLARAGHDITLLERDATPFPANPVEAFANWDRRGAPQVRHSHAFLARLRNLLRDRLPDVLEALMAHGTEELPVSNLLRPPIDDTSPRDGDEDLSLLACRRITFEWVLHRAVLDETGISYRDGSRVVGVCAEGGRVTGVEVERDGGPETLRADLVVDAGGRRSKLPQWLEAAGFAKPDEESEPCGIFYCSRFYRLLPGVTPPERDTTIGADLGYLKYAVFHGDGAIFSVTFAAAPEDKPLRALLRTDAFEAAARALPATARWVDPAVSEPISPVHAMDGLRNTRRFFLRDGEPVAPGAIAIGRRRRAQQPPLRPRLLARHRARVPAGRRDRRTRGRRRRHRAHRGGRRRARGHPLVRVRGHPGPGSRGHREAPARGESLARRSRPRPGPPSTPRAYMRDVLTRGLVPALRLDATVLRAFLRSFNLLDPPGDLLQRPDVLQRVLAVYQTRDEREEPYLGPDRAALIALLEDPHAQGAPHA